MFSTIDVMVARPTSTSSTSSPTRSVRARPTATEHFRLGRSSASPQTLLGCGLFVSSCDDAPESYGQTFPDDFPTPP